VRRQLEDYDREREALQAMMGEATSAAAVGDAAGLAVSGGVEEKLLSGGRLSQPETADYVGLHAGSSVLSTASGEPFSDDQIWKCVEWYSVDPARLRSYTAADPEILASRRRGWDVWLCPEGSDVPRGPQVTGVPLCPEASAVPMEFPTPGSWLSGDADAGSCLVKVGGRT